MATIKITVCDLCPTRATANPEKVVRWSITGDDGQGGVLDLCDKHAKPLRDLMKAAGTGTRPASARSTQRPKRGPGVVSMKDIEALKGS